MVRVQPREVEVTTAMGKRDPPERAVAVKLRGQRKVTVYRIINVSMRERDNYFPVIRMRVFGRIPFSVVTSHSNFASARPLESSYVFELFLSPVLRMIFG